MTSFKCDSCKGVTHLPTRKRRLRGKGHVKTMWCWRCKRRTQHKALI